MTIDNIINNTIRPWKDFKEYIDSRIQIHTMFKIDMHDQIADFVPNEIIKMLWDGTIEFDELMPVTGNKDYIPFTKEQNEYWFNEIFYSNKN